MNKSKSARRRRRRGTKVVYAKESTLKELQANLKAMKAGFSAKLDSLEEMVKGIAKKKPKGVAASKTTEGAAAP